MKKLIFLSIIIFGSLFSLLGTLPVKNELKENDIVKVHFALGNILKINASGANFIPLPEKARENVIRTNGTCLGKIQSGRFKNTTTGDKFLFYVTGKGTMVYFEANGKNYVIDFPDETIAELTARLDLN